MRNEVAGTVPARCLLQRKEYFPDSPVNRGKLFRRAVFAGRVQLRNPEGLVKS